MRGGNRAVCKKGHHKGSRGFKYLKRPGELKGGGHGREKAGKIFADGAGGRDICSQHGDRGISPVRE